MDTIYNKVMKEISPNQSNIRNDIVYEVNSQTPFTGFVVQHYDTGGILFKACYKDGHKKGIISYYLVVNGISKLIKKRELNGPYESYYENGQ